MAQFTQEFKKNALAMLGTLTPTQIVEKLGISKTAFYRWKQQAEHPGKRKRKRKSGKKAASSKRYTDDVKQRAVALVREGKLTQTEIAKNVGCSLFTLRVWCKEQGKKKPYTTPTTDPRLAVGVRYKGMPPQFVSWVANHTLCGRTHMLCGKAGMYDTFSIFQTASKKHPYALQRTYQDENDGLLYHEIVALGHCWSDIAQEFEKRTGILAASVPPDDTPAGKCTITIPGTFMDEFRGYDLPPCFAEWVSEDTGVGKSRCYRMYKDTAGN